MGVDGIGVIEVVLKWIGFESVYLIYLERIGAIGGLI
jgi:hypothetical protein